MEIALTRVERDTISRLATKAAKAASKKVNSRLGHARGWLADARNNTPAAGKPMLLTAEMLVTVDIDETDAKAFKRMFPDGTTVTEEPIEVLVGYYMELVSLLPIEATTVANKLRFAADALIMAEDAVDAMRVEFMQCDIRNTVCLSTTGFEEAARAFYDAGLGRRPDSLHKVLTDYMQAAARKVWKAVKDFEAERNAAAKADWERCISPTIQKIADAKTEWWRAWAAAANADWRG